MKEQRQHPGAPPSTPAAARALATPTAAPRASEASKTPTPPRSKRSPPPVDATPLRPADPAHNKSGVAHEPSSSSGSSGSGGSGAPALVKDSVSLIARMQPVLRQAEQVAASGGGKELADALTQASSDLSAAVDSRGGHGEASQAVREVAPMCTSIYQIEDLLSRMQAKPRPSKADKKAFKAQTAGYVNDLRERCGALVRATCELSDSSGGPQTTTAAAATAKAGATAAAATAPAKKAPATVASRAATGSESSSRPTEQTEQPRSSETKEDASPGADPPASNPAAAAAALCLEGDRTFYGHGASRDVHAARRYYLKAAEEHGSSEAMLMLGVMSQHGIGVERDSEHSKGWLRRAAASSSASAATESSVDEKTYLSSKAARFARNLLGTMCVIELDVERPPSSTKAASQSFPPGAPPSLASELEWLRRLTTRSSATASNEHGVGGASPSLCLKVLDEAAALFGSCSSSDEHGGVSYEPLVAATNLAVVCEATGRMRDAVKWYTLAATRGEQSAQNRLGVLCYSGLASDAGLACDASVAVAWFRKSVAQGDRDARTNLAICFEHGHGGVRRDVMQAASLFRTAAEDGSPHAMSHLAYLLAQSAIMQYDSAGEPTDAERAHARAQMVESFFWFRRAADAGIAEAAFQLAQLYEQKGPHVVVRDPAAALANYMFAADLPCGHPEAAARAAEMLFSGTATEADPLLAARYYKVKEDGTPPP